MIRHRLQLAATFATVLAGLSYTIPASAQGLFAGSKGARVAGRGGAYSAKADDLAAVEYNPAGLTHLGTTTIQVSNRFSYNMSRYQREAAFENTDGTGEYVVFQEVKNQEPWQALDPLIGVGTNFGLEDFAAALVAYAPPGAARVSFPQGGTDILSEGGQRYMMVAREAEMLIYALSAAYKYKKIFGVGATAQWIHVPRLSYSLVVAPLMFGAGGEQVRSSLDMVSEVNASDPFTFNAVVGAWVRPTPYLEIALSGQVVPSAIEAQGTMHIKYAANGTPLETSRINAAGVAEPADDVQLNIPLPLWARLGARYFQGEGKSFKYDVELDVTYASWSRVKNFELTSNNLIAALPAGSLPVGDTRIPKEWKDSLKFELGGDVAVLPNLLTLRAGAGYETAVSYSVYSHVDFPTGPHISGALGASVFLGKCELALAYAYRHQFQVTTTTAEGRVHQVTPTTFPAPPPPPVVNGGTYNSHSHYLNLDFLYRFGHGASASNK